MMKLSTCLLSFIFAYGIFEASGWCISNMTPSTSIWVGRLNKDNYDIMTPTNQTCCSWDNENCYVERKARHPYNYVTIYIACSKFNHVFTKIETHAGGTLNVLKSSHDAYDNFVDAFDENGNKRYWYRCGTENHWEWYEKN